MSSDDPYVPGAMTLSRTGDLHHLVKRRIYVLVGRTLGRAHVLTVRGLETRAITHVKHCIWSPSSGDETPR